MDDQLHSAGTHPDRARVEYILARVLVLLGDVEYVDRPWLRRLCPHGEIYRQPNGTEVNTVSRIFRTTLVRFERAGWIRRLSNNTVQVTDRPGLLRFLSTLDSRPKDDSSLEARVKALRKRSARSAGLAEDSQDELDHLMRRRPRPDRRPARS
jgi:hypothetical protein